MTRALITGITGFAGSHLAELLLSRGFEVFGTARHRSDLTNVRHILKDIKLIEADITDLASIRGAFNIAKPDYVFHLAAQSYVPQSWKAPHHTLTDNILGTCNILEAARDYPNVIIQVAGSSEEYGFVKEDEVPIKETNPLRPLSPYGVSKVASDLLCMQYFKSYGTKVIVTRAFNHSGPRRTGVFVDSNFAKQLVEIEKGIKEPVLYVGNLEAQRDFSDVRDVVRAYLLAVEKGIPGEVYNICSGNGITIKDMLDKLIKFAGVKLEIRQDPERMRPSDVLVLRGNCSKFKEQTGWKPEIEYDQTLKDMLEYWRKNT
ncbi:MAG: GDP-mannose 4,6-dehydratase [Nanoarchaeota archaeon]